VDKERARDTSREGESESEEHESEQSESWSERMGVRESD